VKAYLLKVTTIPTFLEAITERFTRSLRASNRCATEGCDGTDERQYACKSYEEAENPYRCCLGDKAAEDDGDSEDCQACTEKESGASRREG
jgi:hypothetical protein